LRLNDQPFPEKPDHWPKVRKELNQALRDFARRFNNHRIIGRIGYRTPAAHCRILLEEAARIPTSTCLRNRIRYNGVKRSMSRKKNPWGNAVIESFFSALRFELLGRTRFADPDDAKRGISEWIERFYNLHRGHTTLGSVSPINYELARQMRKRRTLSTCPQNRGRLKMPAASASLFGESRDAEASQHHTE
jgi:putative transposase